ncbi:MAG TPA: asparagine synthase (glutamine-hydrolyzing) [Casimicrobiaceae bacterium]|nr:asparagine synthase (glutamine-hydrolyzing) [Casimicrobiaceae bacterium]
MCGIGGVLAPREPAAVAGGLRRMGACMAARGPDAEGTYVGDGVGLVHRRLSILDLSQAGNCPIPNEDGSVQALLNGEIYNWRELRDELVARGHRFRSHCDSEVLVHGYEEWGAALPARLRGMYALAVWDAGRGRLLLARDRLGEKPLYLRRGAGQLVFASTLAAVLAYDDADAAIDADAIACCLAHGFIPATHTVWKGVDVLPPAHYALAGPGGTFALQRYWSFPDVLPLDRNVTDAERGLERVLDDAVGRCLDADVPVGVFLSGGVDSSVVAALAARHAQGLRSFSIGFREAQWNELPHARAVARHLGLDHAEALVDVRDVIGVLPALVWHYGQPFGDASAAPTFLLSRLARRHVKVCLSGDGGDESFAGYWRVQANVYAGRYGACIPETVRRHVVAPLAAGLGTAGRRLASMNTLSLAAPGGGYTNTQSWHEMLDELAGPALRPGLAHDRVACRVGRALDRPGASPLQRLLLDDFEVQLPDAFLTKVDVASMAASLEVRAPLLDVAVVETAWRLPDRMKLRHGERKWILKRIARRLVPSEAVDRPKMGFALPLPRWFRGELGDVLERLLADSVAAREGWIRPARVRDALREHRERIRDHDARLWLALWLELWFRVVATGELSRDADLSGWLAPCAS